MRTAISTDLQLRLKHATPEQYAAVAKILGVSAEVQVSSVKGSAAEAVAATSVNGNADVIQRVGRLAYRNEFADVWLGEEHFDLSRRAKARACLQYLVDQRAFDAKAARDLTQEIDPYVRAQCALPALPGYGELKMHHYFNPSTGAVARLGRELIRPAGRNGRYFLNVR